MQELPQQRSSNAVAATTATAPIEQQLARAVMAAAAAESMAGST